MLVSVLGSRGLGFGSRCFQECFLAHRLTSEAAGSGTAAPATTWRELAVGVEQFRAHYKED